MAKEKKQFRKLSDEELKQVNGAVLKISATSGDPAAGLGDGNKSIDIDEIYRKIQR